MDGMCLDIISPMCLEKHIVKTDRTEALKNNKNNNERDTQMKSLRMTSEVKLHN